MPDVPTIEPEAIQAGDTLTFSKSLPDYPADQSWVLTYYLVKESSAGTGLNFAASASGSDHLVTVAATTTAAWTAGNYRMIGRVSKDGEKYTVYEGSVTILPDLASAADFRSHAKKVLDAIETALETVASAGWAELEVEGFRGKRFNHSDLLTLRDRYRAEYQRELDAKRAAAGLPSRSRILTRFCKPS